MSQWRRLPFVLMALFALFALTVPSLAWACPTRGQIGDALTVCQKPVSQSSASAMPCCAPPAAGQLPSCLGKCCKPVPQLPAQDSNKNSALHQSHLDISGLLDQLSQHAHAIALPVITPVAPLALEPAQVAAWRDAPAQLPPSQRPCATTAGRAPPR